LVSSNVPRWPNHLWMVDEEGAGIHQALTCSSSLDIGASARRMYPSIASSVLQMFLNLRHEFESTAPAAKCRRTRAAPVSRHHGVSKFQAKKLSFRVALSYCHDFVWPLMFTQSGVITTRLCRHLLWVQAHPSSYALGFSRSSDFASHLFSSFMFPVWNVSAVYDKSATDEMVSTDCTEVYWSIRGCGHVSFICRHQCGLARTRIRKLPTALVDNGARY
jgi:hypothetical protein